MDMFEVSFIDGRFIESVTVEATSADGAQESAIEFWEERGVVHGDLRIMRTVRALPLLPY